MDDDLTEELTCTASGKSTEELCNVEGIDSDRESVLSDYNDEESTTNNEIDYGNFLINWKFTHNVTNAALNDLLSFLQKNGHPYLPRDSRTLLKTPKAREVIDVNPGKYVHIGLELSLTTILSNAEEELDQICLDFNVDGLPISRSSNSGFWLILGKIHNSRKCNKVFVIGIYHGYNKPSCFSQFLRPHIDELKNLISKFFFKNRNIPIQIRAYICDAPARSLLSGTKGHNAYFGCNKCRQEGVFINSRMTFPETNAVLRTDESFRGRHDEYYHKETSPMEELSFDMVKQIPLDYLHTVLLGVMKKLIRMWLCGNTVARQPSTLIQQISGRLLNIAVHQPLELQRKIRSLSNFGHFKGTEFRSFLLYAGPVALKDILPIHLYQHFLLLHSSISILCDKETCKTHSDLVRHMLNAFINDMSDIYGEENVIYNVHCLTHLVDDVQQFGSLDEFSSFPFESYMFQIKRLLHKNCQSLAEISNRIIEMHNASFSKDHAKNESFPKLTKSKSGTKDLYNEIKFENFTLNNKLANQWVLTKSLNIIKFEHAKLIRNEINIYGYEIKQKSDFYKSPIMSSALNIFSSNGEIRDNGSYWKIHEVYKKMFNTNPDGNSVAFFPLLHTFN